MIASNLVRDRGKSIGAEEVGQSPLYLDDDAGTDKDQGRIQLYQTSARTNLLISVGGARDSADADQRQPALCQSIHLRQQGGRPGE